MPFRPLPPNPELSVLFVHRAYQMADRFAARGTGIAHRQARSLEEAGAAIGTAHVVCISMLWRNELVAQAPHLAFIQSISAGIDQYDQAMLAAAGIRLASAGGVNANAVAEHAIAMLLAIKLHIHTGRDHQARGFWRPMIAEIAAREDEIAGKTMLVIGMGRIGSRIAALAKAFGMTVIGVRRDPAAGAAGADEIHALADLDAVLARADVVMLACPLTPATENIIDAAAFARMRPTATLINVARGRIVDEAALIASLAARRIAAAALDVTREEPLPAASPLWQMPNVLITPHTAGETQRYEDNVIDILLDNLDRLGRGESGLRNQVV